MEDILRGINIAPSILSADFGRLGEDVEAVLNAGARVIHVDVMDGHFVPNITIGPLVLKSLQPLVHGAGALLDVHLMIEHPERYVDALRGCRRRHDRRAPGGVRAPAPGALADPGGGAAAGVALNPATPIETLAEARYYCDMVLIMSVNPGFGGQSFIPTSTDKIARPAPTCRSSVTIEVDGGVTEVNAGALVAAGANWLVAGSSVFGGPDIEERFSAVAKAAVAGV